MRKYSICPICKAQKQSKYPNQAPRPVLESHLHYRDGQTWVHARHIARGLIVIMEDDNGNEIVIGNDNCWLIGYCNLTVLFLYCGCAKMVGATVQYTELGLSNLASN
jgi:hypothetical protein